MTQIGANMKHPEVKTLNDSSKWFSVAGAKIVRLFPSAFICAICGSKAGKPPSLCRLLEFRLLNRSGKLVAAGAKICFIW